MSHKKIQFICFEGTYRCGISKMSCKIVLMIFREMNALALCELNLRATY